MSLHRAEPAIKHGRLLHLLPIVQHDAVLDAAAHFFCAARNQLGLVGCEGRGPGACAAVRERDLRAEGGDVGDAVVEALAAISRAS